MNISLYWLLLLLLIVQYSKSQVCLGINGEPVTWWVQLIFPGKFSNGFGYMDSTFRTSSLEIHREKADSIATALTRTLNQINNNNFDTVAWNDQWPTGQTSSTKAHSKGLLAFSDNIEKGFYLGHSIPHYPAYI